MKSRTDFLIGWYMVRTHPLVYIFLLSDIGNQLRLLSSAKNLSMGLAV